MNRKNYPEADHWSLVRSTFIWDFSALTCIDSYILTLNFTSWFHSAQGAGVNTAVFFHSEPPSPSPSQTAPYEQEMPFLFLPAQLVTAADTAFCLARGEQCWQRAVTTSPEETIRSSRLSNHWRFGRRVTTRSAAHRMRFVILTFVESTALPKHFRGKPRPARKLPRTIFFRFPVIWHLF